MRVPLAVAAGVLAVLAVGGCKRDAAPQAGAATPPPTTAASTTPTPSTSATASATASRTPTADATFVFAADGVGPYVIGTPLADLQSRGLLTTVVENEHCTGYTGAEGTGPYVGLLTLTFKSDRLMAVNTVSTRLTTPSGARVGMTLTQLQAVYASRGTLITGSLGNKAYLVRVVGSGLAIVFFLDTTTLRVAAMSGGEAQPLEGAARYGEDC